MLLCFKEVQKCEVCFTAEKGGFGRILLSPFCPRIAHPECADFPQLDLLGVTRNNLANMGPDAGEEGISYHVNTSFGEMYMDFHAKESFKADNPGDFGLRGSYGTLNVAGHSTANMVVSFRDFKSKKPVIAKDFSLSFYDLGGYGVEDVSIEGDWSMALVAKDTTVLVHHTEENQRRITFQGTDRSSILVSMDQTCPKKRNRALLGVWCFFF